MKWLILSVLTLIFWVGLYLYIYLGFSKPVTIELTTSQRMTLIYAEHIGAYHHISPVIQSVEEKLKSKGVTCAVTFGEYLDDPKKVDEDRLKSFGGCAFDQTSPALQKMTEELKLEYRVVEPRTVIRAQFEGSPSIGPLKVYPKIEEMIQDQRLIKGGPMIETYEVQGERVKTTYLQPIK